MGLRRLCFKREVSLQVVKNTFLKKALEKNDSNFEDLYDVLKGNTSIMFTDVSNALLNLSKNSERNMKDQYLKAAHLDEILFILEKNI